MSFPTYSEYKNSDIDWLGEVPSHWEVRRLGVYGNFIAGCGFPNDYQGHKSGDFPFYKVSDSNLPGNEIYLDKADNYVSKEAAIQLAAKIAPIDGIMFPKVGAALLGNKRRILKHQSITDNNTMVFKPSVGVSKYWYYWLSELDFGKISNPGPVPSVNESQLKDFPSICPPPEEQTQIANFLDRETAKIDTLIEKQQQLIKLLQEKRQAVISHAVTKGLNPDARMKDSGVEWLGEVPEHWDIKSIRYLGQCQNGINIGGDKFGSGYPFISYGDVYNNKQLPKSASGLVQSTEKDRELYSVEYGDVLFTRTSETIDEIGFSSACLSSIENSVFAGFLIRFRPAKNSNLNALFSKYYFQNNLLRAFFVKEMNLVTRASLSQDLLKKMPVPLPSYDEQQQIGEYLEVKTGIIDSLIEKSKQAIILIKERRTALISAAVTGKIDVRNVA